MLIPFSPKGVEIAAIVSSGLGGWEDDEPLFTLRLQIKLSLFLDRDDLDSL